MEKWTDIPYAVFEGVEAQRLSLDVYAPESEGPHPVIVFIHGGGWSQGDKGNASVGWRKADYFTKQGHVYVSINYRLVPEGVHPVNVQDVARAIAWVHDHSREYRGDPDRIFVMGHSAGAHLAALVCTDNRRLEAEGKDLSIIKGCVPLDTGAFDIPERMRNPGPLGTMLRAAFGEDEEGWEDASPTHHVAPGKHIPPMLIFHTGWRMEVMQQSEGLAKALQAAEVPVLVVHAKDLDHAGINRAVGTKGSPYTDLVEAFFKNPSGVAGLSLEPIEQQIEDRGRKLLDMVEERFESADLDADGRVIWEEFDQVILRSGRFRWALFNWLDENSDKGIDRADLARHRAALVSEPGGAEERAKRSD